MNNVELSPSQQKAEKEFMEFIQNKDKKEFLISGFAGSGKSFLVKYLNEELRSYYKVNNALETEDSKSKASLIRFVATTHKAAKVLSDMVNEPTTTVHRFFGLTVKNDTSRGVRYLAKTRKTTQIMELRNYRNIVLFIDEASMLNWEVLEVIREFINAQPNAKVVYIGDNYQLPPVKSKESIIFSQVKDIVHLNEIQRQAQGNPIIYKAKEFRDIIDNGLGNGWPEFKTESTIHNVDKNEFTALINYYFLGDNHPDRARILAYTNGKVVNYNRHVRALNKLPPEFSVGEWVMTNDVIKDNKGEILAQNESILKIQGIEPHISPEGIVGSLYKIHGISTKVFHPDYYKDRKDLIAEYRKAKDYRNAYRIQETYVDLRSIHALTCHKAQGSTYENVFIDLDDIGTNKKWWEVARLTYVALSRASQRVFVTGRLPIRGWAS
jgi:hypothetical protein